MKKFLIGFFITGLILIGISSCIRTFGQTPQRKASFGAGIEGAPNAEAIAPGAEAPPLKIADVLPNSTAQALGLKVGDIIVSINGQKFSTLQEFGAFVQSKFEGDPIEIEVVSNGEKVSKKGVFKGRASQNSTTPQVVTQPQSGILPRKGWLGVGGQPPDEAKAKANNLKTGEGILISVVSPGATFEQIGIKVGDILLSINQRPINSPAEMIAMAQSLSEGDSIEVNLISNGEKVTKKGLVKGRPKETSEIADVNYDSVTMSLGTLRTITHIPKNRSGKVPAVFYIQGLPCQSNEYIDPKFVLRQAFDDWIKAGFAVFRVERPNLGDSRATKDCKDMDFNEEVETNKAGYRKLLSYDFIDTDNIFFFGHSMGGWTAPFIAEMKQPKGIMAYGTGYRSWFEYLIDLYRIQATYGGATHVQAEEQTRVMIPLLYKWLEEDKSAEEMRKDPTLKPLVDSIFQGEYFNTRSAHYFHTMSKQNLAEQWSKVTGKVNIFYGEFDTAALNARDAITIAEIVNQAHPGNGEYTIVPKTEHMFAKSDSYKQTFDLYASGKIGQYASQNYNPEVGRITVEWMRKAMK